MIPIMIVTTKTTTTMIIVIILVIITWSKLAKVIRLIQHREIGISNDESWPQAHSCGPASSPP